MSKNGLILLTPTTVDTTGGSSTATISANGSVEFSACISLRLNSVFSADYDNYMVVMRSLGTTNGGPSIYARLSSSGSDSTSNYTWQFLFGNGGSVGVGRSSTEGYFRLGMTDSNLRSGLIAWFYGPYLSQPTAARGISVSGYSSASFIDYANTHSVSSQYDGVNISVSSGGTISGRVAVYGMRK